MIANLNDKHGSVKLASTYQIHYQSPPHSNIMYIQVSYHVAKCYLNIIVMKNSLLVYDTNRFYQFSS